jgi:signal transduction histidine kinase
MLSESLILAAFLSVFTCAGVAFYVLVKNPRNQVIVTWGILNISVGFLSFGWGMIIASHDLLQANYWLNICFLGGFLVPSAYLHFVYAFLVKKDHKLIDISYLVSIAFFILFLKGFTVYLKFDPALGFIWWKAKVLYDLYVLHLMFAAVYGGYLLYRELKKTQGVRKGQIFYLLVASILGFAGGVTVFLPAYNVPIIPFGIYPFFLYPLVIAYAIIKYRMMDISFVIRKSLVYTLVIGFFTGIYISAIFFIGQFLQKLTGGTYFTLTLLMIIVFALVFQPLKDLVQTQIDRRFFKSKYDYQKTLKELSHASASIIDLDVLLKLVARTIVERIKIDRTSIYVLDGNSLVFALKEGHLQKEPDILTEVKNDSPLITYLNKFKKAVVLEELSREIETSGDKGGARIRELMEVRDELKKIDAALCIPLFFENKLIGLFNLGNKLSQDMYTDEDIDLLTTLSNQLAIAIENASLHDEMLKAQKQLLMADKLSALGRTAAGLAHEIKNPLAAIKGMTQAIELNPDDPEILNDFKKVVPKEIDRLSVLIDNLTRLGRSPKLQYSRVNLVELVDDTLKLFESRCHNHHIAIVKKFGQLPTIKADPEQLAQVFTNLFLNAIQAMPRGGELSISGGGLPERPVVEVSDTGHGIPKDKLKDIFEPFFSTKEEGMGLGLAITYKIIKDHGGDIEVESQVGRGTKFKVFFPPAS